MNTVTQTMLYRQALIRYANKKGVTKAAKRLAFNFYASSAFISTVLPPEFLYTRCEIEITVRPSAAR